MDTTTKYKVDQHIRAYDFPGLDRKAYFVEGIVLRVDPPELPGFLEFMCTHDSMANEEYSRVGDTMLTEIENDLDEYWEHERIVILPTGGNSE